MNGNPFKPVASGDTFAAKRDWLNEVTRAAQAYRQSRSNLDAGSRASNIKEGLILVGNNSGQDIMQGQVLGISDIFWGPVDNLNEFLFNFALYGDMPDSSSIGNFVVARGPIAKNAIGQCYAFGICPVRVKVGSMSDQWADAVSGQLYLQSGSSGSAQILYLSSDALTDGTNWALIRFPAAAPAPGNFMVNLTQTGGSNGNKTTAATWTYTAKTLNNATTLGTVLSPNKPRPFGTQTAATLGVAYYDNTGTFQLAEAYEKPGSGGC